MARWLRARHHRHPHVVQGVPGDPGQRREGRCYPHGHPGCLRQSVDGPRLRYRLRPQHHAVVRADLQSVAEYPRGRSATLAAVHRVRKARAREIRQHTLPEVTIPRARLELSVRGGLRSRWRQEDPEEASRDLGHATPGITEPEETHKLVLLGHLVLSHAPSGLENSHQSQVRRQIVGDRERVQGSAEGTHSHASLAGESRYEEDQRTGRQGQGTVGILQELHQNLQGRRTARAQEHACREFSSRIFFTFIYNRLVRITSFMNCRCDTFYRLPRKQTTCRLWRRPRICICK